MTDEWDIVAQESLVNRPPIEPPPLNIAFAVAQFCHFYPGMFNSGMIGWRLFWLLYGQIGALGAIERVNMTHAGILAGGIVEGDEVTRTKLNREYQQEIQRAQGIANGHR